MKRIPNLSTKKVPVLLLLFFLGIAVYGQNYRYGTSTVQNYTPETYKANPTNYCVVQDPEGIMYFGNLGYVLQYDGVEWRKLFVESFSPVYGLDCDERGVVYVSAGSEFGFLWPNKAGNLEYVSLAAGLDSLDARVEGVGRVHVGINGVYYLTSGHVHLFPFIVPGEYVEGSSVKPIQSWKANTTFITSFLVNKKRFFVSEQNYGLSELKDGQLKKLSGAAAFVSRNTVAMMPGSKKFKNHVFVATEKDGLFYYTGHGFGQANFKTNTIAGEVVLLNAADIPDFYVLSTINKGTVVIEREQEGWRSRRVIEHYNKKSGLPSEQITAIYCNPAMDKRMLWLASKYGISLSRINSPLRKLHEAVDVSDIIVNITAFENKTGNAQKKNKEIFYVRTVGNIYYLDESEEIVRFLPVKNIVSNTGWLTTEIESRQITKTTTTSTTGKKRNIRTVSSTKTTSVVVKENKILVSTPSGIYKIDSVSSARPLAIDYSLNENGRPVSAGGIPTSYPIRKMYRISGSPTRIMLLLDRGVAILSNQNGYWTDEGSIPVLDKSYIALEQNYNGDIWLAAKDGSATLLQLSDSVFTKNAPPLEGSDSVSLILLNKNVKTRTYNTKNGLPEILENGIVRFDSTVLFSTRKGLYRFEAEKNQFFPDNTFNLERGTVVHELIQDENGNCWLRSQTSYNIGINVFRKNEAGKYVRDDQVMKLFPEMTVQALYPDPKGMVWISGTEGLFNYNTNIQVDSIGKMMVHVRRVTIWNDSVVYLGTNIREGRLSHTQAKKLILPYRHLENNISFEFAAPFFEDENLTQYSYYLEGVDAGWSDWSTDTRKDYMNLEKGNYTFKVKARNVYGLESPESVYEFRIRPPWWETTLFYVIENAILVIMILLSYYWNRTRRHSRLTEILTFLTIITVFEQLIITIEGLASDYTAFFGGIPFFTLIMNIFLAIMLEPINDWVTKILHAEKPLIEKKKAKTEEEPKKES